MRIRRRHFLFLGGLSGFGLAYLINTLRGRTIENTTTSLAVSSSSTKTSESLAISSQELLLRFVAVADTGTGAQGQDDVAKAMANYQAEHPFNLSVLAGDNIYNDGEIEKISAVFEQPYQTLLKQGVKFYACLGNHDVRTDNGEPQIRYPGFNMGGRYYTFRRAAVQFFALDTNQNNHWKAQLVWLEQQLSNSNAPWKIVFGHHPIYSSGFYGVNQKLVRDFTPLFQKHGVQLYISGHDHNYERTHSIKGTTYLICGAGAGTRPVGRSAWTATSASRLSFAALEVYPDRIAIRGIGTDNKVFDQGVIQLHSTS
jgi:acid phosphatase